MKKWKSCLLFSIPLRYICLGRTFLSLPHSIMLLRAKWKQWGNPKRIPWVEAKLCEPISSPSPSPSLSPSNPQRERDKARGGEGQQWNGTVAELHWCSSNSCWIPPITSSFMCLACGRGNEPFTLGYQPTNYSPIARLGLKGVRATNARAFWHENQLTPFPILYMNWGKHKSNQAWWSHQIWILVAVKSPSHLGTLIIES